MTWQVKPSSARASKILRQRLIMETYWTKISRASPISFQFGNQIPKSKRLKDKSGWIWPKPRMPLIMCSPKMGKLSQKSDISGWLLKSGSAQLIKAKLRPFKLMRGSGLKYQASSTNSRGKLPMARQNLSWSSADYKTKLNLIKFKKAVYLSYWNKFN